MYLVFLLTLLYAKVPEFFRAPPDFGWCVATAAHQNEGNNTKSDWWDFEQKTMKQSSGKACDHWNRIEEDTKLLQDLHVNQYRMSLEWAKIEPEEGKLDHEAIEHYQKEIALLHEKHIEPIITLHHFTMPQWLRQKGGWLWAGAPEAFANYASFAIKHIAPHATTWVTFNEPMIHIGGGYFWGIVPPNQKGSIKNVVLPLLGVLQAHAAAYHAMKHINPHLRIGVTHHMRVFAPYASWSPFDHIMARALDRSFNWVFLDALETGSLKLHVPFALRHQSLIRQVQKTQDFIGINYYTRDFIQFHPFTKNKMILHTREPKSNLGWEIYPQGLYNILHETHERYPRLPILVTENGIADQHDEKRSEFLKTHIVATLQARSEGVPVQSYCHWTLMDNFEWLEGFHARFGLYAHDETTNTRTPRPSAKVYRNIILKGGILGKPFTSHAHKLRHHQ